MRYKNRNNSVSKKDIYKLAIKILVKWHIYAWYMTKIKSYPSQISVSNCVNLLGIQCLETTCRVSLWQTFSQQMAIFPQMKIVSVKVADPDTLLGE